MLQRVSYSSLKMKRGRKVFKNIPVILLWTCPSTASGALCYIWHLPSPTKENSDFCPCLSFGFMTCSNRYPERFHTCVCSCTIRHLMFSNSLKEAFLINFGSFACCSPTERCRDSLEEVGRRWEAMVLMGNLQALKVLHEITGDEIHISPPELNTR